MYKDTKLMPDPGFGEGGALHIKINYQFQRFRGIRGTQIFFSVITPI
jgi:hypothetical protein